MVLNVDNSCPNSLRNQEYVKYLFQAQPKGLVTLDFKQNGDYYISCAVSDITPTRFLSDANHAVNNPSAQQQWQAAYMPKLAHPGALCQQ